MMKPIYRKSIWAASPVVLLALGFLGYRGMTAGATGASPDDEKKAPMQSGLSAFDKDGDGIVYQDGMHPWYVQDEPGTAPDCGMDLTPVYLEGGSDDGGVRIDPVTIQNIGVRTAPVTIASISRTVRTTGRFEADEQGLAAVSPKVGGWVEELYINYEGARVRKGQPLLSIYSPELVSTQEEYLLALRHAERMGRSGDSQRLVDAARRRLSYWEITDAQIKKLEETGQPQKTLTLHAPASGTVIRKAVVEGQQIMPGMTLMELSDLSRIWLMVDVYEQDLAWVAVGTTARIELPYAPGQALTGRVDYIYDTLDPMTRTAKARVTLPNPGLRLKPGMYATVTLEGGMSDPAPVVPEGALIRTGTGGIVVVALGGGRFKPVDVLPGAAGGGQIQIVQGLAGGEQVVTSAQFLIDSESRLKSAIGAMQGHAHEDLVEQPRPASTPAAEHDHSAVK